MLGTFFTLLMLAVMAIPIVIVWKIVRRVGEVSSRLGDPTRLQRVFAETAAAALRRAGADPKAIAKVEVLGQGAADERGADLRAALYEARIGMRKRGAAMPTRSEAPAVPVAEPTSLFEDEARPHPRPRRPPRPVAPLAGFDMGDRFRLSEPPEIREPHGLGFNANWLALAALVGAAAYYLVR